MNLNEIIALINQDPAPRTKAYSKLLKAVSALYEDYDPEKFANGNPADLDDMNTVTTYRRKLGLVLDAAHIYLKHFNDDPNGKTNVNRKRIATELRRELRSKYENALKAERVLAGKNSQQSERALTLASSAFNGTLLKVEELQKASDLRKNVGGTGLKVKENTFKPDDYTGKGKWAKIKHGFAWLFSGASVINFTLWVGAKLATRSDIRDNKERIMGSVFDETKVPGTKNEHFEPIEKTRERVNSLDENQPVLNDKKRSPIVYERKIPGDVDAKPTITLKVAEGIEGKNIGYHPSRGTGHGYITLNYSKVNPLTGQKERYELTMGFFPKGGFNALSIQAAQARAGLRIPGQLNCDENRIYSVAKTFEIDNKRINQVILAAQEYEKEGYNSIDRNCSTFVHDMAEVAKVNDNEFIKESEIVKGGFSFKGALLHFGGSLMVRKGVHEMLKKADKPDYSYQRSGQKMITENEVQKLNLLEHHKRMIGYFPSHIGETMRHSEGYVLNARTHMSLNEKTLVDGYRRTVSAADIYFSEFKDTLNQYARKHRKTPGVTAATEQFISYLSIKMAQMQQLGNVVYNKYEQVDRPSRKELQTVESAKKKTLLGIKNVDETVNAINEVYKDAFKSDPKLNVAFSKIVGAFNSLKGVLENDYTRLEEKLRFTDPRDMRGQYKKDYDAFVNPDRDDADAVRRMNFQKMNLGTNILDITPMSFAAVIKTFGSVKDYIKFGLMGTPSEEALKTWNDKDRSFYHKMQIKSGALKHFEEAEKSLFTNDRPYKSDYQMAFIDMPRNENSIVPPGYRGERPSFSYKAEMLDHVFGSRHASDSIKEKLSNIKETDPKAYESAFKKALNDALLKNMQESNEFDKLHEVLITGIVEELPPSASSLNPLAVQANVKIQASNRIMGALKNLYVNSILSDLKYKGITVVDLNNIDFTRDPEFASFRKAYNEKAGVQIDLHEKKAACYKEILEKTSHVKEYTLSEDLIEELKPVVAKVLVYSMISTSGVTEPLTEEKINEEVKKVMEKPGFDSLVDKSPLRTLLTSYNEKKSDAVSPLEGKILGQMIQNKEIDLNAVDRPKRAMMPVQKKEEKKPISAGGKKVK